MMLNPTEAVLVLPVIADAAVTYSVCGPGDRSAGLIEITQPLKSYCWPKEREMIEPCGLPATLSEPLPETRMLTPWTQLTHVAPKLPNDVLSPGWGAFGLSI
jgi:hypothetical protein